VENKRFVKKLCRAKPPNHAPANKKLQRRQTLIHIDFAKIGFEKKSRSRFIFLQKKLDIYGFIVYNKSTL
jgi:hypothetical protein